MTQVSEKKPFDKLEQFYQYYGLNYNYPDTKNIISSQLNFRDLLIKLLGEEKFMQYNLEEQLNLINQSFNDQQVVTITFNGVSTDIIYKKQNICFKSYLTKPKGATYYASDKNIINMISFYALKQNDKLKNGSFSIDPLTGLYCYKTMIINSFLEHINLSQSYLECLKFQIQDHQEVMKDQALLILYQLNKVNFKQLCQFNQNQLKNQQDNYQKLQEIFGQKQLHCEMNDEDKQNYLAYPKPKSLPLLTKIEAKWTEEEQSKLKDQNFTSGGYSEIRKVELTYNICESKQTFRRHLAVKTIKIENFQNKIKKELDILKYLNQTNEKGLGEGYIATSYYDEILEDKMYFMEYYNNGSLDQYVQSKSTVLSLRTKLFILAGIINGIDFLHFKGIVHMDLKLGNVLIQKQLIPKLCDFGEAKYFDELDQDKRSFACSLPYAAPELFNENKITPAYDIFSFGILMCNLIFEEFPFDYNNDDSLKQRYKDKSYKIKRSLDKLIECGPKKIMKWILELIYQCLQPNPDARPKPKWILSIIWKMINFLDSF